MNEDVQVFIEVDGDDRIFIFALEDASITLKCKNTEAGSNNGGLLVANFQALILRAADTLAPE